MKKMIFTALAVIGFTSSVLASASQLPIPMPPRPDVTFTSQLETLNLDRANIELRDVVGGMITRNMTKNEIRLVLFRKSNCPPRAMCIAMMPAPLIIDLPLVKTTQDACGSTLFTAKRDARPVDGSLEMIKITDHSTRTCEDYRALPGIEAEWITKTSGMGGRVETFSSTFTGSTFQEDFQLMADEVR